MVLEEKIWEDLESIRSKLGEQKFFLVKGLREKKKTSGQNQDGWYLGDSKVKH
jgi:hypothetical protein